MGMRLPLLKDANVRGKTGLLRADLDVPLTKATSDKRKAKSIEDDTRLVAGLPTLEYLLKNGAKIIIVGHLGRPQGIDKSLSLKPVAEWFAKKFTHSSRFIIHNSKLGEFDGWKLSDNLFLLENLRFYKGEAENDSEFSKELASLANVYVNDAFAMCHRNHASVVGITKFLPHFAGFHLQKEVKILTQVFQNPKRPLVVIVGGKKIETKFPLIAKMCEKADYILVGGKIAENSKEFLKVEHKKYLSKKARLDSRAKRAILLIADLNEEKTGILENSILNFLEIISLAKTVIWNGSMGRIEGGDDLGGATRRIAEAIVKTKAYSVVGGGDTTEFLRKIGLIDKFSFFSTGGGAMLAFLSGENLPGIEALLE